LRITGGVGTRCSMGTQLAHANLFDWAQMELPEWFRPPKTGALLNRFGKKRSLPILRIPVIQTSMELDNVVRYVPRHKLSLLDHSIDAPFSGNCPDFFYIRPSLVKLNVHMVGHLVQMTERDLLQLTTRKKLVEKMRQGLRDWGLDLGLRAPHWKPGQSTWYTFDVDEYWEGMNQD